MMVKFKFNKLVQVELSVNPLVLDYDDDTMMGESIAYILGGRNNWKNIVLSLCEEDTDATVAENYIRVLHNALDDTLYFQKIFAK
jgi:hypothetical protein